MNHGVKKWAPNESIHLNTYIQRYSKYSKILLKSANLFRFVPNNINNDHLLMEGKLSRASGRVTVDMSWDICLDTHFARYWLLLHMLGICCGNFLNGSFKFLY